MTIAACPNCSEEITVPSQASPQARVRCPLCQEEYQLSAVLEKMPPSLVVVDDPSASSAVESGGATSAQPGDSAIHAFAAATGEAPTSGAAASTFDFQEQSAPSAKTATKPGTGARPRRRKKPKKPAIEVLKIVGGGAVGIIAAILIMWWVIGKDPFKLAPKINSFAPFLVPEDLAKGKKSKDDNEDNGEKPKKTTQSPSTGQNPPLGTNPPVGTDPPLGANPPIGMNPRVGGNQGKSQDRSLGNALDNRIENSVNGNQNNIKSTTKNQTKPTGPDLVGIRNAPDYTRVHLTQAIDYAQKAYKSWQDADSDKADELEQRFMQAFARVGHIIVCIDHEKEGPFDKAKQQMNELFAKIVASNSTTNVSKWANDWLGNDERTHQGIILTGRVRSELTSGKYKEHHVELLSDPDTTVPVLTVLGSAKPFNTDDRMLVLGGIVDDPSTNLGGYDGEAARAVAAGWLMVLQD